MKEESVNFGLPPIPCEDSAQTGYQNSGRSTKEIRCMITHNHRLSDAAKGRTG